MQIGQSKAFWNSPILWLVLALLAALPAWTVSYPPVPDHYSHLARYYVMLNGDDPGLAQFYRFEWKLVGNMGVDLLMWLLGPLFGVEAAAHFLLGLIPALTVLGVYALARVVHGRPAAPALLALIAVYSFPLNFGFLNYTLSVALAFLAAALWGALGARPFLRLGVMLAVSPLLWAAHMAGFAIFLIIVGLLALAEGWRCTGAALPTLVRAGLNAAPLAWPLALTLLWRTGEGAAFGSIKLQLKLNFAATMLRTHWLWFDIASASLLFVLLAWLCLVWVRRGDWRGWPLVAAGGLLGLLFIMVPPLIFNAYYSDARLLPPAVMLFAAGLSVGPGLARGVALAALLFFGVRMAALGLSWHDRSRSLATEVAAIDRIAPRGRVAVFAHQSACVRGPLLARDHIASLAIPRRHAFVNTHWAVPGAQLMYPVYNIGRDFNDSLSTRITKPGSKCLGEPLSGRLAALPRDRFDYVWSFVGPAPATTRAWLTPIARGDRGILYRIERPVPQG